MKRNIENRIQDLLYAPVKQVSSDFDKLKFRLGEKINSAYQCFYKFKHKRNVKISLIAAVIILFVGYVTYLYIRDSHFEDTERVVCSMNERIAFGNNLIEIWPTEESSKKADGYFITVSSADIVSTIDYIQANGIDVDTIKTEYGSIEKIPKYSVVIDVLLENESCTKKWDYSIPIYDLVLYGYDWYSYNDFSISNAVNTDITNYEYAATEVGTKSNFKLIYPISNHMTKEYLLKEDMWLHLTVSPKQLDVKIEF